MKLGSEIFFSSGEKLQSLKGHRVALVAHPAAVDRQLRHSLDLLKENEQKYGYKLASAFGPQHGIKGDKQYNMIESSDEIDPVLKIPIFSLYGKVRRPTREMMDTFDVAIIDLQDLGCRIYTFVTTLLYFLEESSIANKKVIVLDRPNPAGRPVEGLTLVPGFESFVGAAPIPMRHGLTMGEMALWFKEKFSLSVQLEIQKMEDYHPEAGPDWGWPGRELAWVNPSPNAASLNMARAYSGTVLLEGTHLSEGRGTTRPLEIVGAPDLQIEKICKRMHELAPKWLAGAKIRSCYFEPSFYKHAGQLCVGFQIHTDVASYEHERFKPFRMMALFFKSLKQIHPDYLLWRDFAYEYVFDRLAIDVINGGEGLRNWVDDSEAKIADLERKLQTDEESWRKDRVSCLLY